MWAKILFFCLFLVTYAIWIGISGKLIQLAPRAHKSIAKQFLLNETIVIVSYGGFFLFVYLLCGFYSWQVLALFIAVGQIGILIPIISRPLFVHGAPNASLAGAEFALKHHILFLTLLALAALASLTYPIIAGLAYFRDATSPELTLKILRYTLLIAFAGGLIVYPTQISIVGSKNIDERARISFLLNQCGTILPNALFLCLAFLAFSDEPSGVNGPLIEAVPPSIWISVLASLLILFSITTIVPYLVGAHRGNNWRQELLQDLRNWLTKIEESLNFPSSFESIQELKRIRKEIYMAGSRFIDRDRLVILAELIDRGKTPDFAHLIVEHYIDARGSDPRFRYLDTLKLILTDVERTILEIERRASESEKINVATWAARMFQRREAKLRELQQNEKGASPITKLAVPAMSVVVSAFLTGAGKWLWETMSPFIFFKN